MGMTHESNKISDLQLNNAYPMVVKRLLYNCGPEGSSRVNTTSCEADLKTISEENTTLAVHQQISLIYSLFILCQSIVSGHSKDGEAI